MQQSRIYILAYSAILTIICGGLLAFASEALKEKQQANIEMEKKSNILSCVMNLKEGDDIEKLYSTKVQSYIIDYNGNKRTDMGINDIKIEKEYKKKHTERLLPIYEFKNTEGTLEYIVIPVYGYGLWNNIWGYVALKSDCNTIQGIKFQHAGETPGLGARIESEEIQNRFKNKTLFEADELISVMMQKGENQDYSKDPHKVDGMSGATLTAKGVNNMLKEYFQCYQNYFKKNIHN